MKKLIALILIVMMLCSMCVACASTGSEAAGNATGGDQPLKVAVVVADSIETIYNSLCIKSLMKLEEDGYNFEWAYTENCTTDNIESVIRTYCDAGYNVILGWAGISRDAIAKVHGEYPEISFMISGSDVDLAEPNVCAMDANPCDTGFILGALAAMRSKTGIIGAVGAKPTGNENALMNIYAQGAKYVNPDVKVKLSWINSYYDPVKTKEMCNAMMAQGVDVILGDRDGYLDACKEGGIFALGNKVNSIPTGPDFILACSVTMLWNPLKRLFEDHKAGTFKCEYYTNYVGGMALDEAGLTYNTDLLTEEEITYLDDLIVKVNDGTIPVSVNMEEYISD